MTKRRKPLKIVLISLAALIVLLAAVVFIAWHIGGRPSLHSVDSSQMRTMDFNGMDIYPLGFAADALYLVRLIDENHPIFVLDNFLGDDYETIRDEFLAYAHNENITLLDFSFAVRRYITTLRDGHMNWLAVPDGGGGWMAAIRGKDMDILWMVQDERLFLREIGGEITTAEIIEIGGVPVSQIFAVIDRYWYFENEFCRHGHLARFSRFSDVIARAGGSFAEDYIPITVSKNGETTTEYISWIDQNISASSSDFIIYHEMIGDVFFIDLRTFVNGSHIDETVLAIESAIAGGTHQFIIDLRGNGGGNSFVGTRLLEAMGITHPEFGGILRISPLAIEQGRMWHLRILRWFGIDYLRIAPSMTSAANPNDVFVSVLTDVNTFSSAMWMATWVQDGGFGNVIGSPSSNAPTSFGNVLEYTLPYSRISGAVSYWQWLRPDENADPMVLMPDILVPSVDALDIALEYLRNRSNQ